MSVTTCSAAVGVLSLIAVVHILLSIALGGLIALVCYSARQKHREDRRVAKKEDVLARERARDLEELESPDKLFLSGPNKSSRDEVTPTTNAMPTNDSLVTKEDLGAYQSSWANTTLTVDTGEAPSGPGTEEVLLRKKVRISVASIASNISNRFRKSVDLESEEARQLVREASSSERESSDHDTTDGVVVTVSVSEGEEAPSTDGATVITNEGVANSEGVEMVEISVPHGESEC